MKDCNKDIRDYHRMRVALSAGQREKLEDRRNSNRKRLRSGLEENGDPKPKRSVSQGSFAMRTVIQEPDNGYDIDDGVVFAATSLVGPRGAEMSPLDTRKMVREAVHSDSFTNPPEVRPNCVRVYYNDGPHVDIPVYREVKDWLGNSSYELASSHWKMSDPDGVNDWFAGWLNQKNTIGWKHSRELIRLLKSICKNRPSYSLPSGFVITVLIEECYRTSHDRLDLDLIQVIYAVKDRLAHNLWVRHPVVDGEWLIDSNSANKTRDLHGLLATAFQDLDVLRQPNCTRSKALKAWKKVLHTDFFNERILEAEEEEKAKSRAAAGVLASAPKPWALDLTD